MDLRNLFKSHIFARGIDYASSGLVEDLEESHGHITAKVKGTNDYHVQITFDNNEVVDMNCDCPYAKSGEACKHMAAVLFVHERLTPPIVLEGYELEPIDIAESVLSAPLEYVQLFLIDTLKHDATLRQRFVSGMIQPNDVIDIDYHKAKLSILFHECLISDYDEYDDYYSYDEYEDYSGLEAIDAVVDYLKIVIPPLINTEHYSDAVTLLGYNLEMLTRLDMVNNNTIMSICIEYLHEIYSVSPLIDESIFEHLHKLLNSDNYTYYIETLEKFYYESFANVNYSERKHHTIDAQLAVDQDYVYYDPKVRFGQLHLYRLIVMEQEGKDSDIVEYMKQHIQYPFIRDAYIDNRIEHQDYEEALHWLQSDFNKGSEKAGIRLKELYLSLDMQEEYKNILYKLLEGRRYSVLGYYQELKKLYEENEWIKIRAQVIKMVHASDRKAELYAYEGLYGQLISIITNTRSMYLVKEYEELLKYQYGKELLNIYYQDFQRSLEYPSSRQEYRKILYQVKELSNYPSGTKFIEDLYNEWSVTYKARPAMMDEMNKILK